MKSIANSGRLARLFIAAFLLGAASLANALSLGESRLPDFTKLVEENSAAVVNISTTQKAKHPMMPHGFQMPDIPEDSPWGDFLRRFFGEEGERMEEFETQSLGSGFIIDADGYDGHSSSLPPNCADIVANTCTIAAHPMW